MTGAAIVAFGAISALGEGAWAACAGEVGTPAHVSIERDEELTLAGLARPLAARVRASLAEGEERATALLSRALAGCAGQLDHVRPGWRDARIGMVLGTSSGGMRAAERAFASIARGELVTDAEAPTYFGPVARAARGMQLRFAPAMLVLGACASSAIAIGLATRWLARGACHLVLAGGFDDVSVFVAAGFESLRAITGTLPPRPFRVGRDGMALGEGAAVLALVPADARAVRVRAHVTGFAAAADAVHLTAPDREGRGLARACAAALEEAGGPRVDVVGAHATATQFNDPAEWRALVRALGEPAARAAVIHPFKAQAGHTLGAAGALELLACMDAIERGVLPAAAGQGPMEPEAPARLLARSDAAPVHVALKLAAAFGGANAALVLGDRPAPCRRARRPAYLHAAVHIDRELALEDLASAAHATVDRLLRADGLVRLALAAVALLERARGPLAGSGVVVGSALATLETNARFAARIRENGARAAEPRRFPYTSPNAVAGECSIAFGLTGPSFSVGGGLHASLEALAAGALLVESGDAESMVVVGVDEAGPVSRALLGDALACGAVAVLLSAEAPGAVARVDALELWRGDPLRSPRPKVRAAHEVPLAGGGHQALVPLIAWAAAAKGTCTLESTSPPDAGARVVLEAV